MPNPTDLADVKLQLEQASKMAGSADQFCQIAPGLTQMVEGLQSILDNTLDQKSKQVVDGVFSAFTLALNLAKSLNCPSGESIMGTITAEDVHAFLSAYPAGKVFCRNDGWYSASYTLTYTFQGKPIKVVVNNITKGSQTESMIPGGASDIVLVAEEWTGFWWNTIFSRKWPKPIDFCFDLTGTTLDPGWHEIKCP